jgi:bacterioferritin (cytochrome b1)
VVDEATRRAFLRLAGVTTLGGSAVFVAACGGGGKAATGPATTATINANADVDILNGAIDLENTAIAAYAAAAKLLTGQALALGKLFLTHEEAHADGLSKAVEQLGGTPNQPQADYEPIVGNAKTPTAMLKLALMLEKTAVAAYIDAIPKLTDPKLRQTMASIVTDEAEHITVLRTTLGLAPVPTAFVKGSA